MFGRSASSGQCEGQSNVAGQLEPTAEPRTPVVMQC